MANHEAVIDLMNDNAKLTHTVDLLEKNDRIQARLLADTARERDKLVQAIRDIKQATIDGKVCDDVAWFDTITTLHDFCDQTLALVADDVSRSGASDV